MLSGELVGVRGLSGEIGRDVVGTGGGSGTSNYNSLANKPKINGVELVGDKTTEELGIVLEDEVYVGDEEPTGDEVIWIDTAEEMPQIPTKTSELQNDSGFITEIPEDYAKKSDIPAVDEFITKGVDDLTNYYDKEYIDGVLGDIETLLGGI